MKNYYIERDGNGVMNGWGAAASIPDQERLQENHPDVIAYFIGKWRRLAADEIKEIAENAVRDLDRNISKTDARNAVLPFKTQFLDASTVAEVEAVKVAAMAAIDAL